jgi:hypothetical protein
MKKTLTRKIDLDLENSIFSHDRRVRRDRRLEFGIRIPPISRPSSLCGGCSLRHLERLERLERPELAQWSLLRLRG